MLRFVTKAVLHTVLYVKAVDKVSKFNICSFMTQSSFHCNTDVYHVTLALQYIQYWMGRVDRK